MKKHSDYFAENVSAMIQAGVGVTFPRETAQRRHATLLHYKTTADLFAVAPLPLLPSPPVTGIFSRLAIFVFHK